jgi:5-methylcytosine-specific restriction protein B
MTLDQKVNERIQATIQELKKNGKLLHREKLDAYYATFRDRFGPQVLSELDGEHLLETMHAHGNQNSLVYWLEFKDDEELPAQFGSIAGGSALKFGLYRSAETGEWMTGHPRNKEVLSIEQAISKARQHRDEFIRGCEIIGQLPKRPTDEDYQELQKQLDIAAPTINDSAWGHKYFHMIFPHKIDDYHNTEYQRFHLIKMLVMPPAGQGRYVCSGKFVNTADELDIPVHYLSAGLNEMNGRPYRYWRVGTQLGGTKSIWKLMVEGDCIAIGFTKLGDLTGTEYNKASKERLRAMIQESYGGNPQAIGRKVQQLFSFVTRLNERDVVLACEGEQVLGIGTIVGPYFYEKSEAPHRRKVNWLHTDTWKLPVQECLQTTVCELKKYPENRIAAERQIIGAKIPPPTGLQGRIYDVLERKGQVILYGPPGTGKTYWGERAARELAARFNFGKTFQKLSKKETENLIGAADNFTGYVRTCCFHPAYGYEDFIEGYRPLSLQGQLSFEMRDGIFKHLCDDASVRPDKRFYLLVDEINRGDIPRIFGELLTVLEKTKRDKEITLPVSGRTFAVPPNVYVIGTMNTADRSIALLDTALRRRFGFIELMPDYSMLKDVVVAGIPVALWLKRLNQRICEHVGRDARNLQIGHTYFLDGSKPLTTFRHFSRVIHEDIIPLLQEYCYEDYSLLEKILGPTLIAGDSLYIREELFDSASKEDLIAALLAPCPDIATSIQAVDAEPELPDEEEESEDDQDLPDTEI